jgi:hypothetical protein
MIEQTQRMEVFFKRQVVDLDEDDGDNKSSGEYGSSMTPTKLSTGALNSY